MFHLVSPLVFPCVVFVWFWCLCGFVVCLFCVSGKSVYNPTHFPVVDRPCLALVRQCRKKNVAVKLLIDNSACRYILSRAGCGRATRILWMQQRVERKQLMVGPVASSENVADIGTKRLAVPTMKYLMYKLGVYDSETSSLVGHDEFNTRTAKHNLRLITGTSNFKLGGHLIRLIVARKIQLWIAGSLYSRLTVE